MAGRSKGGPDIPALAPAINSAACPGGVYVSPWVDAVQDSNGVWQLPSYPCEINGLDQSDPRYPKWTPGEYTPGVDNVDVDPENPGKVREWAGQKMGDGNKPLPTWNPDGLPENVRALLEVPHLPDQPVKEMFARMKALDPRPFEDKYFDDIKRNMPENWFEMYRQAKYAEGFGVHTMEQPDEWRGQEDELVPAVYPTPRPDTVTICVGIAGFEGGNRAPTIEIPGAEYDYLDFLYAKDQEDKPIHIVKFPNTGVQPTLFCTYSFVPPVGTKTITPYASFKIRGVWKGTPIEWDQHVGSEEMMWFTEMPLEDRLVLTEKAKLEGKYRAQTEAIAHAKHKKLQPVLWPENSWEGNAAKARMWDAMLQ